MSPFPSPGGSGNITLTDLRREKCWVTLLYITSMFTCDNEKHPRCILNYKVIWTSHQYGCWSSISVRWWPLQILSIFSISRDLPLMLSASLIHCIPLILERPTALIPSYSLFKYFLGFLFSSILITFSFNNELQLIFLWWYCWCLSLSTMG